MNNREALRVANHKKGLYTSTVKVLSGGKKDSTPLSKGNQQMQKRREK
jgi:hypothetical protein